MDGWNDFIVVILGWWGEALVRLLSHTSQREIVHFMDGPYAVEVATPRDGVLSFRSLEGAGRDVERVTGEQSAVVFASEWFALACEVIDWCRREDSWSTDAESLRAAASDVGALLVTRLRALMPAPPQVGGQGGASTAKGRGRKAKT